MRRDEAYLLDILIATSVVETRKLFFMVVKIVKGRWRCWRTEINISQ